MTNIKDVYNEYRAKTNDKILYMQFISKVRNIIPNGRNYNTMVLTPTILERLSNKIGVDVTNLQQEVKEEVDTTTMTELVDGKIVDEKIEDVLPVLTDDYNKLVCNKYNPKDIKRVLDRINTVDKTEAFKIVDRLMKSPQRVKKISIEYTLKHNPTYMKLLLRDYIYAFLPITWKRPGRNRDLYEERIMKIFYWDFHHVAVFNDTDILHIYN